MADDKPVVAEEVKAADEEVKPAKRTRKSSLDPAPVVTGPRQRKQAEHYQVEVKEKPEFVIKPGKGTKLGEIPNVHFLFSKLKTDDEVVVSLHNLLFKRPGTANRRKKNLFEFSGLTFEEGEQKEVEKLTDKLNKWTIALLNSALDVFELPRGTGDEAKKESKVERLLKFLEEPKKMSDKDLAAAAAKKKDAAAKKREKAKKAQTPKSASKGGKKAGESAKKGKKSEEEAEEEEEEEPSEEVEEEEEEAEEEQPKKKAKKAEPTPKKAAEKKPASAKKSTGKKRKADEEKDGDEAAAFPTDEEIKQATLDALAVSDVNNTTVRDLLKVLNAKFGKDLSSKKAFVKQIAVAYANSQTAAAKAEEKEGEENATADEAEPPAKKQKTDAEEGEKAEGAAEEAKAAEAKPEEAPEAEAKEAVEAAPQEEQAKAEPEAEETKVEPMAEDAKVEPTAEEAKAEPVAEEARAEPAVEEAKAAEAEGAKEGQDAEMTEAPKE